MALSLQTHTSHGSACTFLNSIMDTAYPPMVCLNITQVNIFGSPLALL